MKSKKLDQEFLKPQKNSHLVSGGWMDDGSGLVGTGGSIQFVLDPCMKFHVSLVENGNYGWMCKLIFRWAPPLYVASFVCEFVCDRKNKAMSRDVARHRTT